MNSTQKLGVEHSKVAALKENTEIEECKQSTETAVYSTIAIKHSWSGSKTPKSQGEYQLDKLALYIKDSEKTISTSQTSTKEKEKPPNTFISLNHFQPRTSQSEMKETTFRETGSFTYEKSAEPLDQLIEKRRQLTYHQRNLLVHSESESQITSVESNNKNFQRVFLSNKELTETLTTSSSLSKITNQEQSQCLSDFQLGRKIGNGKFGDVFHARHKKTGCIFALKRMLKKNISEQSLEQLIREIKIQGMINHPNIVKLYSFFSDDKYVYLLMELCSYGELYALLKRKKRFNEELVSAIILQVSQALAYLHENSIIHRDIKPENILCHKGVVKICDFGWSVSTQVMRETFCGTPVYVSPELLYRREYDNKIDVWSLGILTYELLVGYVPFEIFNETDFAKIVKDAIKFPKNIEISAQAKNFIEVCLSKDPQNRQSIFELLNHPFLMSSNDKSTSEML